jgi:hypothetical protein
MRLFWVTHAIPHDPTRIHPTLTSFADQCCDTLARLLGYVGVLALLAITGIRLWDELSLSAGEASELPPKRAGVWLSGRIPRSPSVSLIFLKRQRLTGYSGIRRWPADFRLVVPRRRIAGPARRDRLYSEPADPSHGRKRTEPGGVIRPRRVQARQLRCISHIRRVHGLGELCGELGAARHALI